MAEMGWSHLDVSRMAQRNDSWFSFYMRRGKAGPRAIAHIARVLGLPYDRVVKLPRNIYSGGG